MSGLVTQTYNLKHRKQRQQDVIKWAVVTGTKDVVCNMLKIASYMLINIFNVTK